MAYVVKSFLFPLPSDLFLVSYLRYRYKTQSNGFTSQYRIQTHLMSLYHCSTHCCYLSPINMFSYAIYFVLLPFAFGHPQQAQATAAATDCSDGNAATNPTGPLLEESWADPCIIKLNNTHYSFATNRYRGEKTINVPGASSPNLTHNWHVIDQLDALPFAGHWTTQPDAHVWAPDVNQLVRSQGPIVRADLWRSGETMAAEHCTG